MTDTTALSMNDLECVICSSATDDPYRQFLLAHFARKIFNGDYSDLHESGQLANTTLAELCAAVAKEAAAQSGKKIEQKEQSNNPVLSMGFSILPQSTLTFSSSMNNNKPQGNLFASSSTSTQNPWDHDFDKSPPQSSGLFSLANVNAANSYGSDTNNNGQQSLPRNDSTRQSAPRYTGLFGHATPTSNTTKSGELFGNLKSSQTPGGSLFDNLPDYSGGLFGNVNNRPSSSLFGPQQQSCFSSSTGGGLFGNTSSVNPGSGLFGNISSQSSNGGIFGNNPGSTQSGGLFGNTTTNNTSSRSLFDTGVSSTTHGGLFGSNTRPTGSLFGNSSGQPSTGGLFGSSNVGSQPSGGLFGNAAGNATSGGSFLGHISANNAGSLFGSTPVGACVPQSVTYINACGHGINRHPITTIRNNPVEVPFTTHVNMVPIQEKGPPGESVSNYQSISYQPGYVHFSPEELRYADYTGGVVAMPYNRFLACQAMSVTAQQGGLWKPRTEEVYQQGSPVQHQSPQHQDMVNMKDLAQLINELSARVDEIGEALGKMKADESQSKIKTEESKISRIDPKTQESANTQDIESTEQASLDRIDAALIAMTATAPVTGMSTPEMVLTPNTSRAQSTDPVLATSAATSIPIFKFPPRSQNN